MRADMHIHSVYWDGLYSPDEGCRIAKSRGLGFISITDHDTMNGDEVKREAAKKYGVGYVSGWEVSAYASKQKVHVLGYGCERGEAYAAFMEKRKTAALERAEYSAERFRELGVPVTLEEILNERADKSAPVHTMHIARVAGRYLGMQEGDVYLQYLARGKPANAPFGRPTPEEAIDCIHASGGVASIAHPGRIMMHTKKREKLIRRLAEYGVDGIEAVYTTHTEEEKAYYIGLAKELGLFVTGGSDTHCEEGSPAVIGQPCFIPDEKLVERLLKR